MRTPKEIIDSYKNGTITFLEMESFLINIMSDENISDIMRLLFDLGKPDKVFRFIENTLFLLSGAESGAQLIRIYGPNINEEERLDLIRRLSAMAKYVSGEIL